jgi:hypothetical protein
MSSCHGPIPPSPPSVTWPEDDAYVVTSCYAGANSVVLSRQFHGTSPIWSCAPPTNPGRASARRRVLSAWCISVETDCKLKVARVGGVRTSLRTSLRAEGANQIGADCTCRCQARKSLRLPEFCAAVARPCQVWSGSPTNTFRAAAQRGHCGRGPRSTVATVSGIPAETPFETSRPETPLPTFGRRRAQRAMPRVMEMERARLLRRKRWC